MLQREHEEMQRRQASLQAALDAQDGTIQQLRQYILQLEEFIRNGRRKEFGPSSEKLVENLHPNLFNEAETVAVVEEATSIAEADGAGFLRRLPPTHPSQTVAGLDRCVSPRGFQGIFEIQGGWRLRGGRFELT